MLRPPVNVDLMPVCASRWMVLRSAANVRQETGNFAEIDAGAALQAYSCAVPARGRRAAARHPGGGIADPAADRRTASVIGEVAGPMCAGNQSFCSCHSTVCRQRLLAGWDLRGAERPFPNRRPCTRHGYSPANLGRDYRQMVYKKLSASAAASPCLVLSIVRCRLRSRGGLQLSAERPLAWFTGDRRRRGDPRGRHLPVLRRAGCQPKMSRLPASGRDSRTELTMRLQAPPHRCRRSDVAGAAVGKRL